MKKKFIFAGVICLLLGMLVISTMLGKDKISSIELYREYESIIDDANKTHDVSLVLVPLNEMDLDRMPTVNKFQHNVDEMVKSVQYISQHQGGQIPNPTFAQEFLGELFNPEQRTVGLGTHQVSEPTTSYADELGMTWNADIDVVVSTPTGSVHYYIQQVPKSEMTVEEMPKGYTLEAVGKAWSQLSSDFKSCAVYQQFTMTKNGVSVTLVPWIVLEVDEDTGAIAISEENDGGDLRNGLQAIPESILEVAVEKDLSAEMVPILKKYLAEDSSQYRYISHEELWASETEDLTWELNALRNLSMDLCRNADVGDKVPAGYMYHENTAYTLTEWTDDHLALTKYELLHSTEEDAPLYHLDHVLMVQEMEDWEREIYGYNE